MGRKNGRRQEPRGLGNLSEVETFTDDLDNMYFVGRRQNGSYGLYIIPNGAVFIDMDLRTKDFITRQLTHYRQRGRSNGRREESRT